MVSIKRTGIPIPSFGAADVSPCPGEPRKGPLVTSVNPSNGIAVRWQVDSMMQLEVSLQHWFRRRDPKKKIMSLKEFFALARKLDYRKSNANDDNDNNKKPEPAYLALVHDLTMEERLLHDLLCVASDPSVKEPLYKIHFDGNQLELIPHTAEQLRRLLATSAILDEAWSKKIVQMIVKYHSDKEEENNQQRKKMTSSQASTPSTKVRLTKGMTIDERVRAKAQARQQHEVLMQERQKEDPQAKLINDKTWSIKLADALWSHARIVLQRQNYNVPNKLAANSLLNPRASNQQTQRSLRCVMSFREIVQTISKSRLGEASAVQIAKSLAMMEAMSPQWIQIKFGKTNDCKPKSFKWCQKTTTVFVIPDNYVKVRSQLTGQPLPQEGQGKIDLRVMKVEEQEQIQPVVSENSAGAKRKRTSPVLAKKLLGSFDDATPAAAKKSKSAGFGKTVTPSSTIRIVPASGFVTPATNYKTGRTIGLIPSKK